MKKRDVTTKHFKQYNVLLYALVLVAFYFNPADTWSQESVSLFELSFEEAMNINVPVYSVSKREERFIEAPSAVYSITAEDINYSGAKKLSDVFRMVPGVDVTDINSFYSGVQSRGFSFFPKYARQMLVLIDGRTVYSPQTNATFWDQIPIFLENIERVEVVRGPNAALYGANAFNGVINIITKDPAKTTGGLLSVTTGNRESHWSTLRLGGRKGRLTYRATAGYHETKGFSGVHDRIRKPKATLRCDYAIDTATTLSVHSGYVGGDRELARQLDPEVTSYFMMTQYSKQLNSRNRLRVHYYHDYRNSALTFGHEDKLREDDIEIQFNRDAERYHLVCGAGYRIDRVRHGFLSGENHEAFAAQGPHNLKQQTAYNHIFKSFISITCKLSNHLQLTTALMVEDNDFIGTLYSPKGSLVFMPSANHSVRFSVARAYRAPSFIEEKADFSIPLPVDPGHIGQRGNPSLGPEQNISFELGYRGLFFNSTLILTIEAFYQNLKDLIIYENDGANNFVYDNYRNNHVRGIETFLEWNIQKWWRMTLSYTFQDSSDDDLTGLIIQQKAFCRNRLLLPGGFSLNAQLNYVDRFHFEDQPWTPKSTVKEYLRLDIRLARTILNQKAEIALIGQNLLDARHYEYPQALSAGEANRMFMLELKYYFGQ
ncbi:MAG: TonB-dependent receptor [Deltaproteobacteria bacterium]|nr:TonB-dependent receptor [Deltaproteobacteria bacterium]